VESQDVAEAIRLVRETLLSYAIDPLTGKIDMDLINTGKSGAAREKVDQIKSIILDILNKKTSTAEYSTLINDVRNVAGMQVEEKWLKDALEELNEEEIITFTGSIRKGAGICKLLN
jgi:DNA replication licensing factor MCM4